MTLRRIVAAFLNRNVSTQQLEQIDWRPVKPVLHGSAINKAGRLVLRGSVNGHPVKIYEAANASHAEFISAVTRNATLSHLFPDIVELRGRAIVAEWVADNSEQPSIRDLAEIQAHLHRTPLHSFPAHGFDYWNDLLWPRFRRAAEMLEISSLAEKANDLVAPAWSARQVLLHPDITPANVIGASKAGWTVIDNELLTLGGLPLLDVCNTAHSLGRKAQDYANAYFALSPNALGREDKAVLNAAWLARVVGSAFVKGHLSSAMRLIANYEAGDVLPFRLK